ncbi:MAG: ABC transporter ATP-binding protein [Chitinivorax sp.]
MSLISLRAVKKTYHLGVTEVHALKGIDLDIEQGEFTAVWGPSGSGKSSLLNLIGMLDAPSSGQVLLDDKPVDRLSDDQRAELRNAKIGFVFQNFNLVPVLSAQENVALPLQIRGMAAAEAEQKAAAALAEVGLAEHAQRRPDLLSGGQRQRVAIARALVTQPEIVIADEPTANLDAENSRLVIELMRDMNQRHKVTFLFSTHDPRLIDKVGRLIKLADGQLVNGEQA